MRKSKYNFGVYAKNTVGMSYIILNIMLAVILAFSSCVMTANAAVHQRAGSAEDSYQPLHIAILMDSSESIKRPKEREKYKSSDPELISRDAAKAFLNCIPSKYNQVALYHYSDECYRDSELTSVDSIDKILSLSNTLSDMDECTGDTHMLDAIAEADKYLQENSKDGYKNVIVVFTDGAENGRLQGDESDEVIRKTVEDTLNGTDTVIYSIAFDYLDINGNHSISQNGYGKKILDCLAQQTGGKVLETELDNINELDDRFIDVINDLCNILPDQIDTFDGDGEFHETTFSITDAIVEADLRISCDTLDATGGAEIHLYAPDEEDGYREVKYRQDGGDEDFPNVWHNADRLATNIKIIQPKLGEWKLTIDKLKSDSPVHINLIRQYNMSLDTSLKTQSGEPDNIMLDENVVLEVKLLSDGEVVNNEYLYNLPEMEAYAFVTKGNSSKIDINSYSGKELFDNFTQILKDRPDTETYMLESTGESFISEIPFNNEGEQTISVWVNSGRFYCYEEDVVNVSYSFEAVKDKELEDIQLKCGETVTVDDISSYASDPDVSIGVGYDNSEILDARIDGDQLVITGKKIGSENLLIVYTSAKNGESFEKKIKVTVENAPPTVPKAKSIEMNVGESLTENGILSDVTDADGDKLTITGVRSENTDAAKVSQNADNITIEAANPGETKIVIEISDGTNTVSKIINVTVKHSPLFYILMIGGIVLVIVIIILIIRSLREKSRRFHTRLNNVRFETYKDGRLTKYNSNYPSSLGVLFDRKGKVTLWDLIEALENDAANPVTNRFDLIEFVEENKDNLSGFKNIQIIGGHSSSEPDRIKGSGDRIELNLGMTYTMIDVSMISTEPFEFKVNDENGRPVFKMIFNTEQE